MDRAERRGAARWLPELAMAVALVILPFVFDRWLGSVDLFTRILIWGIFGLGFDLLFGCTGLLSFGQGAFYGTGGFVTAYLLTSGTLNNVWLAMAIGIAAAAAFSVIVGFLALRRVGIYFAMITLAFGELSYFLENSPLAQLDRRREWLARRAGAEPLQLGGFAYSFAGSWPSYQLVAGFFFARLRVRALRRAVAGRRRADRDPPKSAAHRGARPRRARLQARGLRAGRPRLPAAAACCSVFSRATCRRTPSRWRPRGSSSSRP